MLGVFICGDDMKTTDRVMLESLKVFIEPGSVTELRAFGDATYHGSFDYDHLDIMAKTAGEMASCRGVYFLPNPISLTATNRIATGGKCATDADVVRRRWVLIDIDPERPKDTNATQSERDAAWRVAKNCHALLEALGWQSPIVASSGNGWHLCYPVDLSNDDQQRDAIKALLAGLQERCGRDGANVDMKTYNASRIWKLYGTTPSKGRHTDDRPTRQSWVKDAPVPDEKVRVSNNKALARTILAWRKQAEAYATIEAKPTPSAPSDAYRRAEACLAKTAVSVSGQGGHDAAFHAAMLAVEGFGLSVEEAFSVMQGWNARCSPPWSDRELRHKINDALKLARNPGHMLAQSPPVKAGASTVPYTGPEQVPDDGEVEDDATATDLISLNSSITWLWPGWIQKGTLTALAAEPGVGKTRLCADLLRRMANGEEWPDGQPMTVERGAKVIWIAADSQWAELATIPEHFGFAPETIVLNGTKSNPYGGTNFDNIEDFAKLERRIMRVRPACVYIDTIGNATDKEMTRPDQAKQIFKPLAEIATRTGTSIILVTHLNKEGQALGRRIIGAVRQVIKLECPDPQGEPNRRKLYVDKSNSMKPGALGVTMGSHGNDYDGSPPSSAPAEPGRGPSRSSHLAEDAKWLSELLDDGLERRVKDIIDAAGERGMSVDRCYKAMRSLGGKVVESSAGNRKFWQMTGGGP